jgi:hypothetical protein
MLDTLQRIIKSKDETIEAQKDLLAQKERYIMQLEAKLGILPYHSRGSLVELSQPRTISLSPQHDIQILSAGLSG